MCVKNNLFYYYLNNAFKEYLEVFISWFTVITNQKIVRTKIKDIIQKQVSVQFPFSLFVPLNPEFWIQLPGIPPVCRILVLFSEKEILVNTRPCSPRDLDCSPAPWRRDPRPHHRDLI